MSEKNEDRQLRLPLELFYPVDDFDRSNLKNPSVAVVGYTDVTDATTHVLKSRRGHQQA